jgi:hypothetical protein
VGRDTLPIGARSGPMADRRAVCRWLMKSGPDTLAGSGRDRSASVVPLHLSHRKANQQKELVRKLTWDGTRPRS